MSDVHDQWFSHAFGLDIVRAAEALSIDERPLGGDDGGLFAGGFGGPGNSPMGGDDGAFIAGGAGAAPIPTDPSTGGLDGGLFGGGFGGPGNSPVGGDDGAFGAGSAGAP